MLTRWNTGGLGMHVVCVALTMAVAPGCDRGAAPPSSVSGESVPADAAVSQSTADVEPASGTVLISAAASTKELLTELASQFGSTSGTEIKLNTGPSSGLANQIIAGAPADLFLSASIPWAEEVDKAGLALEQVHLLTNRLALVVPEGNPGGVSEPRDLLSDKVLKVALAGESVPAGMYADQALGKLELLAPLAEAGKIVRGQDVRTALSYVERGEAEAGIVYTTDLSAATGVTSVYEFDAALHDPIVYVLVRLKRSEPNPAADEYYRYLQSAETDGVYARFGFTRLREETVAAPADPK